MGSMSANQSKRGPGRPPGKWASHRIAVYLDEEQYQAIQDLARERNMPASMLLRELALAAAKKEGLE